MPTLLLFLLQAAAPQRSIDDAVAAFAKGDDKAREDILKTGIASILPLRRVRKEAPEKIDGLIYEIKTQVEDKPSKQVLDTLEAARSIELGQVPFEAAVDDLSRDLTLTFDPMLFRTHGGKNVTLTLKNRPRRDILDSICSQLNLDYGFFYGVVLIAEPARLWPVVPPVFRDTPLTAEESDRAAKLIERLSHDDFQEREQAQAELKKLGKGTIPLLEKGSSVEDAERRARCLALVRTFTAPPAPATFHRPAAAQQKLAEADEALRKRLSEDAVSFKVQDIVLDGAMRLLLQPREIPFQLAGALRNPRVTLDLQNLTAWAVISVATHSCGADFLIQNGQVVIDMQDKIQKRLAEK
jgi:hypothetical protein